MSTKERLEESLLVDEKEQDLNEIVLFNDDVNIFDHVIQTLIDVCEHTPRAGRAVLPDCPLQREMHGQNRRRDGPETALYAPLAGRPEC